MDVKTQLINLPYIFRGSIRKWRAPWIVGIICLTLYQIYDLDFYHFYIYFFAAGFLIIYVEWLGWGELRSDGLLIRYGPLNQSQFFIKWDEIKCIRTVYKTNYYLNMGTVGGIYDEKGFPISFIGIELKGIFPNEISKSLKGRKIKMIFGQAIELNGENTITLNTEPECGVAKFYSIVSKFTKVGESDFLNFESKENKIQTLNFIDILIFIVPILIFALDL